MIRICRKPPDIRQRKELDSLLFEYEELIFGKDLFSAAGRMFVDGRHILPVKDENGKLLFYLKQEKDYLSCGSLVRLYETNYGGCDLIREKDFLDTALLEGIDTFIFQELEEYSWAAARFLAACFPRRRVVFLDGYASLFFGEKAEVYDCVRKVPCRKDEKCMYILSDGGYYDGKIPDSITNIYNSINLVGSLCWARTVSSHGPLNAGRTILLIDFESKKNGIGDIVKNVNAYALLAWERGWEAVVSLSGNNQYLDSPGENMWEYYFEPLSEISVQEALQSRNVISLKENGTDMSKDAVSPLVRRHIGINNEKICLKYALEERFRAGLPQPLKGEKVLGVIARGTDITRKKKTPENTKPMLDECREVMEQGSYTYLFLATEDQEYQDIFQTEFKEKLISIPQKRIRYDYEKERYRQVSELLELKEGKRRAWGEKYLFITYCLSRCASLLYNVPSGPYYLARKWKETAGGRFQVIRRMGDGRDAALEELRRYALFIKNHRRTVVWGTGYLSESTGYLFRKFQEKIVFCDRRAETETFRFMDRPVISPGQLREGRIQKDTGILVMAADYAAEIEAKLLSWGVAAANIMKVSKVIAPETVI